MSWDEGREGKRWEEKRSVASSQSHQGTLRHVIPVRTYDHLQIAVFLPGLGCGLPVSLCCPYTFQKE
jgi:hypothetical protein